MKIGLKIGLIVLFSSMLLFCVNAQGTEEKMNPIVVDIGVGGTNTDATGVDCFDYYDWGSIEFVFLHADQHRYNAGDTVNFSTTIKNHNPYPIVEGGIYAQVYWINEESGSAQGDNLIEEFWVMEDLTLDKNQEYPLAFNWEIPEKAPNGHYYVALFHQVKKSFNLSGLPFVSNVYGGSASFEVENGQQKADFYFDRNTVRLQGEHQMLRNFSQSFEQGETIEYMVGLKNPTDSMKSAYLEYRLYKWDQTKEENLLAEHTKKEFLSIESNSSTDAEISLADLEPGAYLLQLYSEANNWYSIINLRFSVKGEQGRFIFSGIDKFPLKKGDSFTLFSCFSNTTDWSTSFNGRVEVELTANGKTIGTAEFDGEITPEIIAVKKDLTAGKEIDKAYLTSRVFGSDGEKDQEITIEYDFSQFRTEEAFQKYYAETPTPTTTPTTTPQPTQTPTSTPKPTQTPTPKPTPKPLDTTTLGIGIAVVIVILLITYFVVRGKK